MRLIPETIAAFRERGRSYLMEDSEKIAESNLRYLKIVSAATPVLLVSLIIIAALLFPDWAPSFYHIAFTPISAFIFVLLLALEERVRPRTVTWLCVAYQALLYLFVILVDTVTQPWSPSSFMQLICIALPSVFILPDALSYGLLLLAEAAYLWAVVTFKDPNIVGHDVFGVMTGVLFSVCVSGIVSNFRLEMHDLAAKFERLSRRDTLSSLYNKRAFVERTTEYLENNNPFVRCSLAFIDLDDFKRLNDTMGHAVGDAVLADMGRVLREQFRPTDVVARFGGDEFVVLLDGFVNEDLLRDRFVIVRRRFADLCLRRVGCSGGFSAGLVMVDGERASFDELLSQADAALYRAKQSDKGGVVVSRYEQPAPAAEGQQERLGRVGVRQWDGEFFSLF